MQRVYENGAWPGGAHNELALTTTPPRTNSSGDPRINVSVATSSSSLQARDTTGHHGESHTPPALRSLRQKRSWMMSQGPHAPLLRIMSQLNCCSKPTEPSEITSNKRAHLGLHLVVIGVCSMKCTMLKGLHVAAVGLTWQQTSLAPPSAPPTGAQFGQKSACRAFPVPVARVGFKVDAASDVRTNGMRGHGALCFAGHWQQLLRLPVPHYAPSLHDGGQQQHRPHSQSVCVPRHRLHPLQSASSSESSSIAPRSLLGGSVEAHRALLAASALPFVNRGPASSARPAADRVYSGPQKASLKMFA